MSNMKSMKIMNLIKVGSLLNTNTTMIMKLEQEKWPNTNGKVTKKELSFKKKSEDLDNKRIGLNKSIEIKL